MAFTKARAGESSGAKLRDGLRDGGDEVVAGRQTWRAEAGSEKGEPGVRTCVARERVSAWHPVLSRGGAQLEGAGPLAAETRAPAFWRLPTSGARAGKRVPRRTSPA